MGEPVRLFGRLRLQHRGVRHVESIRLRVQAPVPVGAAVTITDTQLQPGDHVTGWTLHPADLGVAPAGGWEWRNAVVAGGRDLVIAADVTAASPTVWDVRGNADSVQVGEFRFGAVTGQARVDGLAHTATQGAGIPPHVTARADVTVPVTVTGGRALVCCWLRGLAVPDDTNLLPPPAAADPSGPLADAHPEWWQVLAHHDTWANTLAAHPTWR